jgi:hypothetical protein
VHAAVTLQVTGEGKALTAEVSIRDDQNKTYFFEINSTSMLSFACKRVSEEFGNDEGASDCAANADALLSMPLSLDAITEIVDWESLLAMYQVRAGSHWFCRGSDSQMKCQAVPGTPSRALSSCVR